MRRYKITIISSASLWIFVHFSYRPTQSLAPELEAFQSQQPQVVSPCEDTTKAARDNQPSHVLSRHVEEHEDSQSDDGYEIMKSVGPQDESPKANIVVLKEGNSPPIGGTVNLILSFGNTGDTQVEVLDLPSQADEVVEETSEAVHRVRNTPSTSH